MVILSAVKATDNLNVTADYLLSNDNELVIKDTVLLKQFYAIDAMVDDDKNAIMTVINAFIRDAKARDSYK